MAYVPVRKRLELPFYLTAEQASQILLGKHSLNAITVAIDKLACRMARTGDTSGGWVVCADGKSRVRVQAFSIALGIPHDRWMQHYYAWLAVVGYRP